MNIPIVSAIAAGIVSLASFFSSTTPIPPSEVVGNRPSTIITTDIQFNQLSPEIKGDLALQHANHTRRIQAVEGLLRSHDASWMRPELQAERARNLDRLRDYWQRGEYPMNYEHPGAWEPVFIDLDGNICAVGYLVEQSLGRKVAEEINSRYHFAAIRQIDAPELKQWIDNSGLTYEEVVAIQAPAVEPRGSRIATNRRPSRVVASEPVEPRTTTIMPPQRQNNRAAITAQPLLNTVVTTLPAQVEAIAPTQIDTVTTVRKIEPPVASPGLE
ncbi:MAG: hypothetical protein IT211_02390 [Armatimonadetes bacterium]|nr:hypothetical protein [Armatimonadota bacterium]